MRLNRDDSLLLVIDVQRKLAPAIAEHQRLIARTEVLVTAAEMFAIPKLVTEHCPQQIGELIEPLRSRLAPREIFEKTAFSATDHAAFNEAVNATGRRQIVMAGMEAHVCVLQAALGLRAQDFDVYIAVDAVGSRPAAQLDRELALTRMADAGCVLAGTETVLFEWTRGGTDPAFRRILPLVKAL